MKAQEELEKILAFDATMECKNALLECKEEELERLASIAEKTTATMEGEAVSRTRNTDPLGEAVLKIQQKEKEIELLKDEIEQIKAEHEQREVHYRSIIDNLRKPVFIKILYGKYFLGKSLNKIAEEQGFCYRNICYLHGNALQAVENAERSLNN